MAKEQINIINNILRKIEEKQGIFKNKKRDKTDSYEIDKYQI